MLKLLFFSILLIPLKAFSNTVKLDEKDLPALLEDRNGRVLSSKVGVKASEVELGYLKRSFLPNLQLDLGYESTDGTPERGSVNTYGFGSALASVNLFNGGKDLLREKTFQANLQRAQTELADSKFDLLTLARSLYWRMVYQQEVINVLEASLKLNEKNLDAALKKIRNNLATGTDKIDFDQTKIQFNQDIQKAKILLANNMRQMAAILHHSADTVYEVQKVIPHDPGHELDKFKSEFKAGEHREVKAIKALQLATQLESEIKSRWWTPQLDIYGLKTTRFKTLKNPNEIDREPGEVLGVKLSFFFDGFQTGTESVADSFRARGLSLLRHQVNHEIETSYKNSYQLYELNHDLVHSAEDNNKLAQRYYDNTWNEYVRGIKNSPDVLQAFQRVVQAKLRYAEIKRDYQLARAEILGFLEE